jgi:hypothetical protein
LALTVWRSASNHVRHRHPIRDVGQTLSLAGAELAAAGEAHEAGKLGRRIVSHRFGIGESVREHTFTVNVRGTRNHIFLYRMP